MTCHTIDRPRTIGEILKAIESGEAELRNTRDADVARRLRSYLADLGWEWTRALDDAERARLDALYPVTD